MKLGLALALAVPACLAVLCVSAKPVVLRPTSRNVHGTGEVERAAVHKKLTGKTCWCSQEEPDLPSLSTCATNLGDKSWCSYRICSPKWNCVDKAAATHNCREVTSSNVYRCEVPLVLPSGMPDHCLCDVDDSEHKGLEPFKAKVVT
jgi:hypothetical protein